MNQTNRNNQTREVIVDKLHETLSVLRRERDELHRSHQLAVERLRLLREEKVAAETNLQTLQKKYDGIVSSNTQDKRRGEISKLQVEVERLGREAKFQHMELVGKRDKMNKLKSCIQEEEKDCAEHLRDAKKALLIRREKVAVRQANHQPSLSETDTTSVEKMKALLAEDGNGNNVDFFLKIVRLLEKKTSEVQNETTALHVEIEAASRRVVGYEYYMQKDGITNNYSETLGPVLQQ